MAVILQGHLQDNCHNIQILSLPHWLAFKPSKPTVMHFSTFFTFQHILIFRNKAYRLIFRSNITDIDMFAAIFKNGSLKIGYSINNVVKIKDGATLNTVHNDSRINILPTIFFQFCLLLY